MSTPATPTKADPQYKRPAFDWESRAYWEGAGRGELVLQRCRACGVVQHRPRGICASCLRRAWHMPKMVRFQDISMRAQ